MHSISPSRQPYGETIFQKADPNPLDPQAPFPFVNFYALIYAHVRKDGCTTYTSM